MLFLCYIILVVLFADAAKGFGASCFSSYREGAMFGRYKTRVGKPCMNSVESKNFVSTLGPEREKREKLTLKFFLRNYCNVAIKRSGIEGSCLRTFLDFENK